MGGTEAHSADFPLIYRLVNVESRVGGLFAFCAKFLKKLCLEKLKKKMMSQNINNQNKIYELLCRNAYTAFILLIKKYNVSHFLKIKQYYQKINMNNT